MLLLNFSHPLTDEHQAQLAALLGTSPTVRDIPVNIDRSLPLTDAALELVAAANLSPVEWQTEPLLINPPGLAPLALVLIATIHGRCGYFPPILNIRPILDSLPPRFEIAEIVNLQPLRDEGRATR